VKEARGIRTDAVEIGRCQGGGKKLRLLEKSSLFLENLLTNLSVKEKESSCNGNEK